MNFSYYDLSLRPHTGLPNGITPAQAAGIDLHLGENKIKALIEKSAGAKEQAKREYNIETQLGKKLSMSIFFVRKIASR